MGPPPIRIVSDVHYADKASRVRRLSQLDPLFEGVSSLILNGDTLDTRPSKHPARVEESRREVLDYFSSAGVPVSFLTGNHDPDISREHAVELAAGRVLVTHGDVLFDNIVPWSRDAKTIRTKIIAALAALPGEGGAEFEDRLGAFRRVAATIPQLHQVERNPLRYAVKLAGETVWPPQRVLTILKAWREAPGRAAALARRHRPKAGFIVIGHTHRPGVWRTPNGVVVVNTGSFCRPFGAMAADVTEERIRIRSVRMRSGAFHPGPKLAEYSLS